MSFGDNPVSQLYDDWKAYRNNPQAAQQAVNAAAQGQPTLKGLAAAAALQRPPTPVTPPQGTVVQHLAQQLQGAPGIMGQLPSNMQLASAPTEPMAPPADIPQMAGGGLVAFAHGGEIPDSVLEAIHHYASGGAVRGYPFGGPVEGDIYDSDLGRAMRRFSEPADTARSAAQEAEVKKLLAQQSAGYDQRAAEMDETMAKFRAEQEAEQFRINAARQSAQEMYGKPPTALSTQQPIDEALARRIEEVRLREARQAVQEAYGSAGKSTRNAIPNAAGLEQRLAEIAEKEAARKGFKATAGRMLAAGLPMIERVALPVAYAHGLTEAGSIIADPKNRAQFAQDWRENMPTYLPFTESDKERKDRTSPPTASAVEENPNNFGVARALSHMKQRGFAQGDLLDLADTPKVNRDMGRIGEDFMWGPDYTSVDSGAPAVKQRPKAHPEHKVSGYKTPEATHPAQQEQTKEQPAPNTVGVGTLNQQGSFMSGAPSLEDAMSYIQNINTLRGGAYQMPQEIKDKIAELQSGAKEDKWIGALTGMLGGTFGSQSPYMGQAAAEGMLKGLGAYQQGAKEEDAINKAALELQMADARAPYLAQQAAADKFLQMTEDERKAALAAKAKNIEMKFGLNKELILEQKKAQTARALENLQALNAKDLEQYKLKAKQGMPLSAADRADLLGKYLTHGSGLGLTHEQILNEFNKGLSSIPQGGAPATQTPWQPLGKEGQKKVFYQKAPE